MTIVGGVYIGVIKIFPIWLTFGIDYNYNTYPQLSRGQLEFFPQIITVRLEII